MDIFGRETIYSFQGEYRFLSNFYPSKIRWRDYDWPSAEHVYQSQKCADPLDYEIFKNPGLSAGAAKRISRHVKCIPLWDSLKFGVMFRVVSAKFTQNPDLLKKLKDTGDRIIEEGNTWGDTYWGVYNGKGQNNLGKILMNLRDTLG